MWLFYLPEVGGSNLNFILKLDIQNEDHTWWSESDHQDTLRVDPDEANRSKVGLAWGVPHASPTQSPKMQPNPPPLRGRVWFCRLQLAELFKVMFGNVGPFVSHFQRYLT